MAEKKDIFYLNKIFPEADKIFSENFKGLEQLSKEAVFVLDTNVLLIPYDTNEKNLNDIKQIYLKYKASNRLFIPTRVAREFANNRANKIGDVFLQVRQLKNNLNSGYFKIEKYPLLEQNKDFQDLLKQFELIQKSLKVSRKLLDNIESHIQSWTWNDSVSNSYNEIFSSDIIVEVQKSCEELEKDLAFRIEYKVAPGYKDSKKLDDGIGDLVIWQTILEIGKNLDKDVIFVTNDQKNDWFYKQDKVGLYPKFELFDEFRRFTNGKSIAIINFVKFLEISDADAKTIEDVKTTISENTNEDFQRGLTGLIAGLQVEHPKFGFGQIIAIRKSGKDEIADILFNSVGLKSLLLGFARLKILESAHNFLILNPNFGEEQNSNQSVKLDRDENNFTN